MGARKPFGLRPKSYPSAADSVATSVMTVQSHSGVNTWEDALSPNVVVLVFSPAAIPFFFPFLAPALVVNRVPSVSESLAKTSF